MTGAAGAATTKVKSATGGDSVDELNPDRLKLSDETGPQGNLP